MCCYFFSPLSTKQIGLDVCAFGDAIRAYHRLIDLREKHIDAQALGLLTKAVSENLLDDSGKGAECYRSKLLELFGRVTATVSGFFL